MKLLSTLWSAQTVSVARIIAVVDATASSIQFTEMHPRCVGAQNRHGGVFRGIFFFPK